MLTKFKVENFKSIHSLELELGRVNVFIGENGSGKSNVLEAVALASAALQDRLGSEHLSPRGVRITEPVLFRSAFEKKNETNAVEFSISYHSNDGFDVFVEIQNENQTFSEWKPSIRYNEVSLRSALDSILDTLKETLQPNSFDSELEKVAQWLPSGHWNIKSEDRAVPLVLKEVFGNLRNKARGAFGDFIIYFPENTALRNFSQEGQIQPLGIHGQGLFRLLQYFASETDQPAIRELNERLQLFGWFDSFALPERLWPGESFLKIKDRYLDANIEFIDQRSANEGFLFVLFYLSLFISKDTPKFFAIDNIETSLNPKMCTKLMTTVAELAKAHDKQVMITTHSPAILDGINLNDDEQRLFVVYRNAYGHTVAKRVFKPQPLPGQEPTKLSELFMMGHLGGLPKNFSL